MFEVAQPPGHYPAAVIEEAKTGAKVTQIVVTLTSDVHKSLQTFAQQEKITQDDAAGSLIEEALQTKGMLG